MNTAYYSKERKLKVSAIGFTLTGIRVLKSVQLSFYQKYIILLLQNGMIASSLDELVKEISSIINFKEKCVEEFILELDENKKLFFDEVTSKYRLIKELHVEIIPQLNNAMFADLDVKEADCDKIVFLPGENKFYLGEEFSVEPFKQSYDQPNHTASNSFFDLNKHILENDLSIRQLITKAFSNTNMYLQPDFSYSLKVDSLSYYQIEFPALMKYVYSKTAKKATRTETIVQDGIPFSKEFIDQLSTQYDTDNSLPRFIQFDETFYQKIYPNSVAIAQCEKEIEQVDSTIPLIQEELTIKKQTLEKEQKIYKKAIKKEDAVKSEIGKKLEKNTKDIENNKKLIGSLSTADDVLIYQLKRTIEDLQCQNEELQKQFDGSQQKLSAIQENYQIKEAALYSEIEAKNNEIKVATTRASEFEQRHETLQQEYMRLVKDHREQMNSTIKSVIAKYPIGKDIFNRYVHDVCVELDRAISASDAEAFDEVANSIDKMRELYRKMMQTIFDILLSNNGPNLGIYFTDAFKKIEIENLFRAHNIPLDIFNKMIIFHGLANAIGHIAENGSQKASNARRVEGFRRMSKDDREKILLSIPSFLGKIEFSKKEVKMLNSKLSLSV